MLNGTELNLLFSQVFGYSATESGHRMGFLVDVPSCASEDTPEWGARRALVMKWARALAKTSYHACMVYAYESVGRHNAELRHPVHCISLQDEIPDSASHLVHYRGEVADVSEIYSRAEFWIALTQFSVVGPIKIAAARYGFRAAALPEFSLKMLPALSIDVASIDARVSRLAHALTHAQQVDLFFDVKGQEFQLTLDLRFRMGFSVSGRFINNGQAGTLPSGEAYIVPYEGEKIGMISLSEGILPLECDGNIALCEISENRIVCIDGNNVFAEKLRRMLSNEPAMSNIAELGLGVLGEWGITAVGQNIHDEKLGVHIGLGRSEHLGGVTSPADFRVPASASHVDYIFHHSLMPDVLLKRGVLYFNKDKVVFIQHEKYMYDDLAMMNEERPY